MVTASEDKDIHIFNISFKDKEKLDPKYSKVFTFKEPHSQPIYSIGVDKDNKYLISTSIDETLKVYNIEK